MVHIEGFDTFTDIDQISTPYQERVYFHQMCIFLVGRGGLEPPMFLCQGFTDPCPRQLGIPPDKTEKKLVFSVSF